MLLVIINLYSTAMNPDAIANHFYEQGKADAMKQSIAATKNISMDPRKGQSAAPQQGTTYRSVRCRWSVS